MILTFDGAHRPQHGGETKDSVPLLKDGNHSALGLYLGGARES